MIKAKLDIPSQIVERLKRMDKDVKEGLLRGMRKSMFLAEKIAKESFNTPDHLNSRSGTLRRSITGNADWSGTSVVGSLGSHMIYAAIHEMGGTIRARAGGYLRFKIGSEWKTVKEVVIPERQYLRPAIVDNLDKIRDIITKEIIEEVEKK